MPEFLYVPGDENSAGSVHKLVLTRLVSTKRVYWVVHFVSEDAVSRLMVELKRRELDDKRITTIASSVRDSEALTDAHRQEWARSQLISDPILANKTPVTVGDALKNLKGPCLLGVEVLDDGK